MGWEDAFSTEADAQAAVKGRGKPRTVTVGWTVRTDKSSVIWQPPVPFSRQDPKRQSGKSVQACPAAIDFDLRHFVVPFPLDITLQFKRGADGRVTLQDVDGDASAVRPTALKEMLVVHPQAEWRHPERPLIQMIAPYVFVADEPCYLIQTPPYLHYFATPRPGMQIGGRFPIHLWPRPLSWGFEWYDIQAPLTFKRGEPWFYVSFETENPAGRVRLVEQERTEEFDRYVSSIVDTSNYVNRTYSLFEEAQRNRPTTLVQPKNGKSTEA